MPVRKQAVAVAAEAGPSVAVTQPYTPDSESDAAVSVLDSGIGPLGKFASSIGLHTPLRWEDPDSVADPIRHKDRMVLAAVAIGSTTLATSLFDDRGLGGDFGEDAMSQVAMITGAFLALLGGVRRLGLLRGSSSVGQRLRLTGFGILGLALGSAVAVMLGGGDERVGQVAFGVGISMLFIDWRAAFSPARPHRIVLLPTLVAAVLGALFVGLCDGEPVVGAGFMAGLALALQVASPFDPNRIAYTSWVTTVVESDDESGHQQGCRRVGSGRGVRGRCGWRRSVFRFRLRHDGVATKPSGRHAVVCLAAHLGLTPLLSR